MAKTKKRVIGYICGTDTTDLFLGATDVIIYPSIESLKKDRKCWEECGIEEVILGDVVLKGDLSKLLE